MPTRRKPYTVEVWGSGYRVRSPDGLMSFDFHSEDSARTRAELCNTIHDIAVKLERARVRRLARAGKGKGRKRNG